MLKMLYYYKIIDKVSGKNGIKQDIYCKKWTKSLRVQKYLKMKRKFTFTNFLHFMPGCHDINFIYICSWVLQLMKESSYYFRNLLSEIGCDFFPKPVC